MDTKKLQLKVSLKDIEETLLVAQQKLKQMQQNGEETVKKITRYCGSSITLNIGGTKFMTTAQNLQESTLFVLGIGKENQNQKFVQSDGVIFVDRDPKHFPIILSFLRNSRCTVYIELSKKDTDELIEICEEIAFYEIEGLYMMVLMEWNSRFDKNFCCPTIELSNNGKIATRKGILPNQHHSVFVCNLLPVAGERYFEFRVNVTATAAIMFGVLHKTTRPKSLLNSYPGAVDYPGFSYLGTNGNIYQNAASTAFGETYGNGDYIGMMVFVENNQVKVRYYKNRISVKSNLNPVLVPYDKAYIVVNLYAPGDEVEIITDPDVISMLQ